MMPNFPDVDFDSAAVGSNSSWKRPAVCCPVVCNRIYLFAAVILFYLTVVIGCGDPVAIEAEEMNITIANLADAAADRESFRSFFVDGAAPGESQRHRYRDYYYAMKPLEISGDSATVTVRITDANGQVLGEKEWGFSKVGTRWKINSAPLP
jgi:hypothetical protein